MSETTVFVYSSGKLIAEYSTAAPPPSPTTQWTVTDQLGSPRILVNSLGEVVSRRDFMPFGEELFPDGAHRTANLKYTYGDNVRQKFTGYQKDDETGLDFAEARMYENRFGRFTAVDPLLASGKSSNPQTFNRYIYVGNNPILRVDPGGEDWYLAKHVRVTYGKTFVTYEPYWSDNILAKPKWTKGVYRVGHGENKGKWIALDPWSNNFTVADSRRSALAALSGYRDQMKDDVVGGAVRIATDTLNAIDFFASSGRGDPTAGIRPGVGSVVENAVLSGAGIHPNENSQVFQTTNRFATALSVTSGGVSFMGGGLISGAGAFRFAPRVDDAIAVPGGYAPSMVPATTGSYLHRFESGKFYAGKGSQARMRQTGRFLTRTYDDPLVSSEFFPASSAREGFINEHKLMMENGGPLSVNPASPTYNKIRSPGCRFFCPR